MTNFDSKVDLIFGALSGIEIFIHVGESCVTTGTTGQIKSEWFLYRVKQLEKDNKSLVDKIFTLLKGEDNNHDNHVAYCINCI